MPRTENPAQSHLLTPAEAAQYLRWTLSTIYTAASRRKLPSVKVGGSLRFKRGELEKIVKAGSRAALMPLNGQTTPKPER